MAPKQTVNVSNEALGGKRRTFGRPRPLPQLINPLYETNRFAKITVGFLFGTHEIWNQHEFDY